MQVYSQILNDFKAQKKSVWILIDPDKISEKDLEETIKLYNSVDNGIILFGGSFFFYDRISKYIDLCKKHTKKKLVLFPGNPVQFNEKADALLYLSLISGRNAETLIGYHVVSAPHIKRSGIEVIPTGYILIDGGAPTSVSYMSNTQPIPRDQYDIAASTALAGELLGLRLIYLDAGSGAAAEINTEMIKRVKNSIQIPLVVGGGIDTLKKCKDAFKSGADIVVVGNAIEKNKTFIHNFKNI